jgi:hypothetical protein
MIHTGCFLLSMESRVKLWRKLSRRCSRGGPSISCWTSTDCLIPVLVISVPSVMSCERLPPIHDFFGAFGPVMVVDVLPSVGTRSCSSMLFLYPRCLLSLRRFDSLTYERRCLADDGADARPARQSIVWRSGRRVARHPAVIPIPGSTVDQMATSRVASSCCQHSVHIHTDTMLT